MKDLLRHLRNGSSEAFEEFFWLHNAHVYNFIFSLLHDKFLAEDLTQNVFMKIWEKHENIEVNQSVDSYLFTIARHLVYKEMEMQLREVILDEGLRDELADTSVMTEEKIDLELLQTRFDELIQDLPPMRRKIFTLSRKEFLSYKEIAARLSISEKTVENQINRAIKYFRARLIFFWGILLLFLYVNWC